MLLKGFLWCLCEGSTISRKRFQKSCFLNFSGFIYIYQLLSQSLCTAFFMGFFPIGEHSNGVTETRKKEIAYENREKVKGNQQKKVMFSGSHPQAWRGKRKEQLPEGGERTIALGEYHQKKAVEHLATASPWHQQGGRLGNKYLDLTFGQCFHFCWCLSLTKTHQQSECTSAHDAIHTGRLPDRAAGEGCWVDL